MAYIIDDTKTVGVDSTVEQKKFPWGTVLVLGLVSVAVLGTLIIKGK